MSKEILFDALTAAEVAERLARMEVLAREYAEHQGIVNVICLTLARASGCAATDVVSMNSARTGVCITPQTPEVGGGDIGHETDEEGFGYRIRRGGEGGKRK